MENEKINITKLESELAYYKGFYEGGKGNDNIIRRWPNRYKS